MKTDEPRFDLLSARQLADKLKPMEPPRGRVVARIALCASLAGGAALVVHVRDASADVQVLDTPNSGLTGEEAAQAGYADGFAAGASSAEAGLSGNVSAQTGNATYDAAFDEGSFPQVAA